MDKVCSYFGLDNYFSFYLVILMFLIGLLVLLYLSIDLKLGLGQFSKTKGNLNLE